jgi:FkbM family methyltransferase
MTMLFTAFEKYLTTIKGAIHIGGHEGQEREWYKSMGFTKVIWFEPNVDIYRTLVKNIDSYPNNTAYNLGIHDTLKNATLHISSNRGESSSILELGKHKEYHPRVHYVSDMEIELVRMDSIMETVEFIEDFNFLNIDVQGVELNVIKSFGDYISKLDYIYCEVNTAELYKGCSLLPEIDEYLLHHGFIRLMTKMTENEWGDAFYKKY